MSQGTPSGCRVVALPAGICLAAVEALLVWVMIDQIPRFFTKESHTAAAMLALIAFLGLISVALYVVGAMAWVCLSLARTGLFLKGSVIVKRGVVMHRRINLRTARVELRSDERRGELVLVAKDRRSRKSLDLLLRTGRTTLPAVELAALAEAITGDLHAGRPADDDYAQAMIVADTLSQMAAIEP